MEYLPCFLPYIGVHLHNADVECIQFLFLWKPTRAKVRTEDLGKITEYAVCLAYDTPYGGNYKYSVEKARTIEPLVRKVVEYFPEMRHTAARNGRYDFTSPTGDHLSVKSSKTKKAKVAPQVIGQPSMEKLQLYLDAPVTGARDFKRFLQENSTRLLDMCLTYTFDCPNLFYSEPTQDALLITRTSAVVWGAVTWTRSWEQWTNSSTLKTNGVSLLEVQFHSASRSNLALRWDYMNLLREYAAAFHVIALY